MAGRVVVPLDGSLPEPEEAWAALARDSVRGLEQRLVEEVPTVVAMLQASIQAHVKDLSERVLGEALRENGDLRTRLAAADDALLHFLRGAPPDTTSCRSGACRPEFVVSKSFTEELEASLHNFRGDGSGKHGQDEAQNSPSTVSPSGDPATGSTLHQGSQCEVVLGEVDPAQSLPAARRSSTIAAGVSRTSGRRNNSDEFDSFPQLDPTRRSSRSSQLLYWWGYRYYAARWMARRLLKSGPCECSVASIIMLNCLFMGLEAHAQVTPSWPKEASDAFDVLEQVFSSLFVMELSVRLFAYGSRGFTLRTSHGRYNLLDALVVFVSCVLGTWVLPWLESEKGLHFGNWDVHFLRVLRATRLGRVVRLFHRIQDIRELWMIVRGLGDSARTLVWTCVVIVFATYLFAVLGLVVVVENLEHARAHEPDPDRVGEIDRLLERFGGLDRMMYSLIQVLMSGDAFEFMRSLLKYEPWSWMYFFSYFGFVGLVLMNLVTAIIVEHAMAVSMADQDHALAEKEATRGRNIKELRSMFFLMDSDASGTISWEEFKASFSDPEIRNRWMLLDFRPDECKELFQLLDDGDGEIQTSEFFEGLERMRGPAQSKDMYKLHKELCKLQGWLEEMRHSSGASASRGLAKKSTPSPAVTKGSLQ